MSQPSLLPRGLRARLVVAFSLMSVMPLLVLGYVVTMYVLPRLESFGEISLVVLLTGVIAFLGLAVVRSIVVPIIRLASHAQEIAEGRLEREIEVEPGSEVGSLGTALNQITQRVRENMSQLRVYGEQTKHMNLEINRRILTLSHLLQVSNLISQSAKIEEIIAFILEKLSQVEETELNCVLEGSKEGEGYLVRAVSGSDSQQAAALQGSRVRAPWLDAVLREKRVLVIDAGKGSAAARESLEHAFGMTHAVCQPIVSIGQGVGILLSANRKPDFVFHDDCLDLLKVFGKQITIALENELLSKRADELNVIDELTGLYNASYVKRRLDEEIQRSVRYRRSCALIMVNVDNFRRYQESCGELKGEKMLKKIAQVLASCVTEVDRVGRMAVDEFALVLPERNKREAIDLAEMIRTKLQAELTEQGQRSDEAALTISAGVSENPIDGSTGSELLYKAAEGLLAAKREGKNRVAVA